MGKIAQFFYKYFFSQNQDLKYETFPFTGDTAVNSSFVDHYVDVLFALNKKYFDNLCQLLTGLVNTDGFPSANVNKDQKQQFATLILKERANKRKFQEIVREFSLACSGLAGTQQAVQMAQVLSAWDRVGDKAQQKIENQAAVTNAANAANAAK